MSTQPTGQKSDEPSTDEYDVAIVGGGASGLAAAVFTARYGFETVVFDRGPSAIHRCYSIGNYLGFLGIDPAAFLELGRAHAQYEGSEIVDDFVVSVERDADTDGFRLRTQDGCDLTASSVIAASAYNADYLSELDGGEFHESGTHPVDCEEATGRTAIDGLYVAGWLSGSPHQVLISAGHGARVAKSLIEDRRLANGFWEEVAQYWDWQVEGGTYGDESWRQHIDDWVEETIPDDKSISEERRERVTEAVTEERLDFQLSDAEREQRMADGTTLLREHVLGEDPQQQDPKQKQDHEQLEA
ncbi:NAD(P)-binding protein [Halocatena salina]|uniref:NAD(P)-binding protein n=1 Tax=Halocatena salina TaxID=2934340 RepID=A0A8U0A2H4_9EURY|nr:NAD(P)-binding protein [Halocatena salina]UPM42187.1 NAD(P)-binding protein [Halocatena salina]